MTKTIINGECLSMLSENGKQTKSINHKITINTITPTCHGKRSGRTYNVDNGEKESKKKPKTK